MNYGVKYQSVILSMLRSFCWFDKYLCESKNKFMDRMKQLVIDKNSW